MFQVTNKTAGNLVGAALFGDGAGAAILSRDVEQGLNIIDHQSYLIPNSRHLMGYDIYDTGPHLRLDRELPAAVTEAFPDALTARPLFCVLARAQLLYIVPM